MITNALGKVNVLILRDQMPAAGQDEVVPAEDLLAHDGNAARADDGGAVLLAVLPDLLARARALALAPVTLPAALQREGDAGTSLAFEASPGAST